MRYLIISALFAAAVAEHAEANFSVTLECSFPEINLGENRPRWDALNIIYEIPGDENFWEVRGSELIRTAIYDKQTVTTKVSRSSGIANQTTEYTSGPWKGESMNRQGSCKKVDPKDNMF